MTRTISMWAAPRNVSTAMMYSWNQRSDTTVLDEPMYAHYLRVTGLDHPVRDQVLATLPSDEDGVLDLIFRGGHDTPLVFIKNMAHHLEGMGLEFIDAMDNFILTRDPYNMLPSFARGLERTPTMLDAGYEAQVVILDRILGSGKDPIVVDSATLLNAPEPTLETLCDRLGVVFDPGMLSWPSGPKSVDGVWAGHWYERLHATTGFEPTRPRTETLPPSLMDIYARCAPLYERLSGFAI